MFDFVGQIGHAIMYPLYVATSAIMIGFHYVFGGLLGPTNGFAWMLSIIGLTLVVRAALIPLFVKQIKSSRNMQLLQPKVKELQKKYGHDRERLAQETMKLYKETGTNPFASCLPLILQMPIFFALFRMIEHATKNQVHSSDVGLLSVTQVHQLANATIFGAKIGDSFTSTDQLSVRIFAGVLVVAMTATTFLTQRQLMSKNMPADAMTGQYAQQQKMLLYVLPLVFAVGGIAFPLGVLFYWTTSNLWTMGQQFYVIRNNPAPGTPAFRAKEVRDAEKAAKKSHHHPVLGSASDGTAGDDSVDGAVGPGAGTPQQGPEQPRRQQPKRQSRSQRKNRKPAGPAQAAPPKAEPAPPNGQPRTTGSSRAEGDRARRSGSGDEAAEPGA